MTSFSPDIKIFEEYNQKIEIWEHPRIWRLENEDCYSDFFLTELKKITEVLKIFVSEGYSEKYISTYNFKFLRKLAYNLSKTKDIKESFHQANGWSGKLGLELAKAQMKIFRKKFGRIPLYNDEGIGRIPQSCQKGLWKEFGIRSWNDLLKEIFNEVNLEQNLWIGKRGYEYAKKILKDYYENNLKLPKAEDYRSICTIVYNHKWKEFGINTWNDLLKEVFGKVNEEKYIYTGFKGLMYVKRILLEFYNENKRLPIYDEKGFGGIADACSRKRWKEFGINGWNDMLYFVFNRTNEESKFLSIESFNKGKNDIKAFFKENNRKPFSREFKDIRYAIYKGFWNKFGIKTWNGLLIEIFGEVKKKHEEYCGEKGFNKAKEELLLFSKIHGRLPTTRDKLSKIKYAIKSRYWEKWQILTWNDLIRKVFGKVNNEINIYTGKKGLERVKDILVTFHRENGRIPCAKDCRSIAQNCNQGSYHKYGINCWNDLLLDVFERVNLRNGIWIGLDGLDRAKKELTQFYTKNGRLPTARDKGTGGINHACRIGKWKEYGINSWNDLLKEVFGKVNILHENRIGLEGLKHAKEKLTQFYIENGRKPTAIDKGIPAIVKACFRGNWKEFGINSWLELKNSTFKKIICIT